MNLPDDPFELAITLLLFSMAPLVAWVIIKHLLSGFLPAGRAKVPKPGKLEKILSPHLKSFVASLPRAAGDPLAAVCEPIAPGTLPYFDNHGYVNAVYPLWKSGSRYSLASRSWARRKKERTEFVWTGDKPEDDWDWRALTEQGFLADTMIDVLQRLDWNDRAQALALARRAAGALGFRYLDDALTWYTHWIKTDWSKLVDEDDDESVTAEERAHAERFSFVRGIDARLSAG